MRIEPERLIEVKIDKYNVKGFLAIDKLINNKSWGGLRIIPDPTAEEMIASARTMTLKYAFVGYNIGGAKAALELPLALEDKRPEIVFKFGEKLADILKSETWMPGIDMACTIEDLKNLFLGAGINIDVSSWKNISNLHTAWTVYFATLAALKFLKSNFKNKTYCLQGFGKVGGEYCKLMEQSGAKLIATSTRSGAIYNKSGINVNEILDLREKYADNFVFEYKKGEKIESNTLLELDVDIAVPCARCWAINSNNVNKIKAKIIPCAANVAMDIDIEKELRESGKIIIPDFVANCGGSFGSLAEQQISNKSIYKIIKTSYQKKITQLLRESSESNRTISEIAIEQINKRPVRSEVPSHQSRKNTIKKAIRDLLPVFIREPLLLRSYSKKYFN